MHTAIGGSEDRLLQQLPGVVLGEDEVLDVDRPFRSGDQLRTQHQAGRTMLEQMETGKTGMSIGLRRELFTQPC